MSLERRRRSVALWKKAVAAWKAGDVERTIALTRQRIEESGDEAAPARRRPPARPAA